METASAIGNTISVIVLSLIGLPLGGILAFIGYNYLNHGAAEKYDPDKHGDYEPNKRVGWTLLCVGGLIIFLLILNFIVMLFT